MAKSAGIDRRALLKLIDATKNRNPCGQVPNPRQLRWSEAAPLPYSSDGGSRVSASVANGMLPSLARRLKWRRLPMPPFFSYSTGHQMGPDPNTTIDFHVEIYDIDIRVWPLRGQDCFVTANVGRQRTVYSDNAAVISRQVTFSRKQKHSAPYSLRYRTRNDGFIAEPRESHENAAAPQDFGRYHDTGTETIFTFRPQPSMTYSHAFTLYKGFDVGHRVAHFHIHPNTHIASVRLTLDLSGYSEDAFTIEPPRGCHESRVCRDYCTHSAMPEGEFLSRDPKALGQWSIEFANVASGAISAVWDVRLRSDRVSRDDIFEEVTIDLNRANTLRLADVAFRLRLERFAQLCKYYEQGAGSYNKVSELIGVNRATVMRTVDDLAEQLGVSLFNTGRRGIRVTMNGHALHHWIIDTTARSFLDGYADFGGAHNT